LGGPQISLRARSKRLRFLIFYAAGRLVHHHSTVQLAAGQRDRRDRAVAGSPAIPTRFEG
jgi:hypothetical protein